MKSVYFLLSYFITVAFQFLHNHISIISQAVIIIFNFFPTSNVFIILIFFF